MKNNAIKHGRYPFVKGAINIGAIAPVKNGLMHPTQAAYCIAHKGIINPRSKDLKGIYGASGPDLATVLLSFDPKVTYCIDIHRVDPGKLEEAKKEWGNYSESEIVKWHGNEKPLNIAIKLTTDIRNAINFWHINDTGEFTERLIMLEMKSLGVDKKDISINEDLFGNTILQFPWAYPGKNTEKERTFIFVQDDIASFGISAAINLILKPDSIDFYYQKSAMSCMLYVDEFLPRIADAIRNSMLISPISIDYLPGGRTKYQIMDIIKVLVNTKSGKFTRTAKINEIYKDLFDKPGTGLSDNESAWLYCWFVELWKKSDQ